MKFQKDLIGGFITILENPNCLTNSEKNIYQKYKNKGFEVYKMSEQTPHVAYIGFPDFFVKKNEEQFFVEVKMFELELTQGRMFNNIISGMHRDLSDKIIFEFLPNYSETPYEKVREFYNIGKTKLDIEKVKKEWDEYLFEIQYLRKREKEKKIRLLSSYVSELINTMQEKIDELKNYKDKLERNITYG